MTFDFRPIVLAQLGNPPPPTRAAREAVYERVRAEFAVILDARDGSIERAAHALALEQTIDEIEDELFDGASWQRDAQAPQPGGIGRAITSGRGKALAARSRSQRSCSPAAGISSACANSRPASAPLPRGQRSIRRRISSPPAPTRPEAFRTRFAMAMPETSRCC
jgi:hypothetical protein